ncbi:MAG: methyl-accepting chemotaxis protein [Alphaproteobacteria bacterium]|nr:methyl-accepting chemotaxis protein [Alphaproteobacteria bacterium]
MAEDHDLREIFADTTIAESQERTFLGGIDFSTRAVLLAFAGLVAMVVAGGVYYFADQKLSAAARDSAAAQELRALTARVEKGLWQIRGDEKDFLVRRDPRSVERYERTAAALNGVLSTLYARPDTGLASEHITTLDEGLTQYTTEFQTVVQAKKTPGPGATDDLVRRLAKSARDFDSMVAKTNSANLKDVVARMRRHEKDFIRQGATRDLARINDRSEEFGLLLASSPVAERDKSRIRDLLKSYQANLTAYARAEIPLKLSMTRLDDIFAYMLPSVDGLATFAEDGLAAAARAAEEARTFARTLVSGGVGAILALLTLVGIVIVRSIATPVRALAQAANRLADGDGSVPLPALGNSDEAGELAAVLTVFRENQGEIGRLRGQVAAMRAELEKSEAALKRSEDVEMRDGDGAGLPVPRISEPAPISVREAASGMILSGPISAISRQLAESSQSVSTKAYEAERTGTLIKNLGDAARRIGEVETLLSAIGEQTNFLVLKSAVTEGLSDEANKHLVVLSTGYKSAADQRASTDVIVRRRLDAIRTTAGEASRAIRGIANSVAEVKEVAMDIAASTSAEALAVTTALLAQSECLRGMLDDLAGNIHGATDEAPLPGPEVHETTPTPLPRQREPG